LHHYIYFVCIQVKYSDSTKLGLFQKREAGITVYPLSGHRQDTGLYVPAFRDDEHEENGIMGILVSFMRNVQNELFLLDQPLNHKKTGLEFQLNSNTPYLSTV